MKRLIAAVATLLIIITCIPATAAALNIVDQSCMSAPGQWIGNMCPSDQTGNGSVVDCNGMRICNRPTGGTCTQSTTPIGWECVMPDGTRIPCAGGPCEQTVPTCETSGGIKSPVYNYSCSQNATTYLKIDECQNACGAACECPIPGLYNQSVSLCVSEPTYECPVPYAYNTTYYECIIDRKCPDMTAWDDGYGKCIGDPKWVCPNAPAYTYVDADLTCEKKPPDCPTSTSTPPIWDETFHTDGKCTTTREYHCAGEPAYSWNGTICTAGTPTCSQGSYDPTHDRCEVNHTAPTCDTANGYNTYDPANGECYKIPPTCSAGGWSYTNHRCEQGTTPGPATCSINNYTYANYDDCVYYCKQVDYIGCVGGPNFSGAGVDYLYGGPTITITGSGSTLSIGGSVSTLTGFTASGSCTVSTTSASTITASGSTWTFNPGGCTITFTGITWNYGQIPIVYPPCGSHNGGFLYTISVSGNMFGYSSFVNWGSYTEGCPYAVSFTGGGYGTCPYTGQPCTGPNCSQTTAGTCTQTGGTCSAGWTPAGSVCWQNGTCPGGGNYQPAQDRCWKMATNPCPPGMTYDGAHVPTVCQMAAYCPPGGSIAPADNLCESTFSLVCPANYANYDGTYDKCWADPICPNGAYDPNAKYCWQQPQRVCPNPTQTEYVPALDKCTAELTCPPPGLFDSIINKCTYTGTANCQEPYTYDSTNHRCQYTPPCTPSDWMCPLDSSDPVCNNTAPIMKKTYLEIGTGSTDSTGHYTPPPTYTFATFTTPMIKDNFETQAAIYGALPAELTYKDTIIGNFGNGPFWVQNGALYADVFFNTEAYCNTYTDFATPPRTWRPKDQPTVACANWPHIWERYETACLCTQFTQDTYTRTCTTTPPYFTESTTPTTTTIPVDTSTCSGTPLNCTAGLLQQGINQCTDPITTFGTYISCPIDANTSKVVPQTRMVKTCSTQVTGATFPVETRTIPINNFGIMQWNDNKCTPCQAYNNQTVIDVPTPPVPPEEPPFDPTTCTNFTVFSGSAKRCHEKGFENPLTDCCQMSGWFKDWCEEEEKELKKRKLAGTCHKVGSYCAKRIKFLFVKVCVQNKETFCCFSSKLSRILNEQIRPQLNRNFGSAENPDCTGFTPEEFTNVDFSQVNLDEYVIDVTNQVKSTIDNNKSANDIKKGLEEWVKDQVNPSPATKKE